MVNSRARFPAWKQLPDRRQRRPKRGGMRGKQTPPEVVCAIRELLLNDSGTQDILELIKERYNYTITAWSVHKERYALGLPGIKTGRPKGARDHSQRRRGPNTKWSPNRALAKQLRNEFPEASLRDLARMMEERLSRKFSGEGVRKLLMSDEDN